MNVSYQLSVINYQKPLTYPSPPSRGFDLSHKGRGIQIDTTTYARDERKCLIVGKDTSPLVGEVAQSAGEGYPRPIVASFQEHPHVS